MINIKELEQNLILAIEMSYKNAPNYNLWINSIYNIMKRTDYTDAEKLRRYNIIIDNIKAYNEQLYYNSPLTILKDTIGKTLTDLTKYTTDIGKNLKNTLSFLTKPYMIIIILILLIYLYFLLNKQGRNL